ncbi:MAG: hypothetical protein J0L77_02460 [Alphaproteobacteria bacterium]|nr:hypothetical protein [Alphaproteobacteria bacterium]
MPIKTQKLLSYVAPIMFFMTSAATVYTAPNNMVIAGGIGLAASAATAFMATAVKSTTDKVSKLIPAFALAANIPLTINGIILGVQGVEVGNYNMVLAGGLLALANSVFYGISNVRGLKNNIKPIVHAKQSMFAGISIAGAGAVIADPTLLAIGAGFFAEAAMRFKSNTLAL